MSFHVGQEVVCVDDRPEPLGFYRPPTKGNHYTIAEVMEITGSVILVGHEMFFAWDPARFRPLHKRSTETGFSILEDIRKKASEKRVRKVDA